MLHRCLKPNRVEFHQRNRLPRAMVCAKPPCLIYLDYTSSPCSVHKQFDNIPPYLLRISRLTHFYLP